MLDNRAWTHVQGVKDDPHGLAPTNELEIKPLILLARPPRVEGVPMPSEMAAFAYFPCCFGSRAKVTQIVAFIIEGLVQSYDSGDAPRSISGG